MDNPEHIVSIEVDCHECSHKAAKIELSFAGSLHSFAGGPGFSMRITGFIGEVMSREGGSTLEQVQHLWKAKDFLRLHNVDRDLFGFICRQCEKAYCYDCWQNIHDVFDEGFHEGKRATCPKGHEQMLED